MIETLIVLVPVLISVAFFTLAERNLIAIIHNRKGPNKVSTKGILQPMSDALKLITNEWPNMNTSNNLVYLTSPLVGLASYILIWIIIPVQSSLTVSSLAILMLVAIMSTTIIFSISTGWSSNSKFTILGSYRSTAQAISYEISIAIFILGIILSTNQLSTIILNEIRADEKILFLPITVLWGTVILAETSRTPFDFTESESELVSGFNTEYSGVLFSIFFIAEYMALIFICILSSILFYGSSSVAIVLGAIKILFYITIIRITLPRSRYDNLMNIAWLTVIPFSILFLTLVIILLSQNKSWNLNNKINKMSIPIITYIAGATSFCTANSHVIPMLISIELIVLALMAIASQIESSKTTIILSILIVIVSEGVTGLTIMLNTTNANGNDLLSSSVI